MKKKISILINALEGGGAERVVSLMLEQMEFSHDITLVLISNSIEYKIPPNQKIISFNQPIHENGIITILKLPFLALRYKRFCKGNNIQTSISFLKRPNYINCLSKFLGNKSKIIISERSYLSEYLKTIPPSARISSALLTRKLYPFADLIIPNSKMIKIDLQNNFNLTNRFRVINNPIHIKSIQAFGDNIARDDDSPFTFINVGRFGEEKNHTLLLNAFSKIRHLNVRLFLVGKGYRESMIRQQVKELDLENQVTFTGFDIEPYKYLFQSDCFVLSSNFEGFPNCIIEAQACGLPIISTDIFSGPREILAPSTNPENLISREIEIAEYGILVPAKNADKLAEAMELIMKDDALYKLLSSQSKKNAVKFDSEIIIESFGEAIDSP